MLLCAMTQAGRHWDDTCGMLTLSLLVHKAESPSHVLSEAHRGSSIEEVAPEARSTHEFNIRFRECGGHDAASCFQSRALTLR